MTKYKLRSSVGIPADVVGKELERISEKHGTVTADVVLLEAKPAKSALHKAFNWDDAKAAHQFRLYQARTLIRAVHIIEEDGSDGGCAFVRVSVEDEGGDTQSDYRPVAQVVRNPDLFASAVRALSANVESARAALGDLQKQALKQAPKKRSALSKAKTGLDMASENLQRAVG